MEVALTSNNGGVVVLVYKTLMSICHHIFQDEDASPNSQKHTKSSKNISTIQSNRKFSRTIKDNE